MHLVVGQRGIRPASGFDFSEKFHPTGRLKQNVRKRKYRTVQNKLNQKQAGEKKDK